jgi:hypothetical protein
MTCQGCGFKPATATCLCCGSNFCEECNKFAHQFDKFMEELFILVTRPPHLRTSQLFAELGVSSPAAAFHKLMES